MKTSKTSKQDRQTLMGKLTLEITAPSSWSEEKLNAFCDSMDLVELEDMISRITEQFISDNDLEGLKFKVSGGRD